MHDVKLRMAGFKDKYECTRCQKKIIQQNISISEKQNHEKLSMAMTHSCYLL